MRTTLSLIVALAFAAPVALVGCDRQVSESSRTVNTPAGSSHESKTVTKDIDGGATVTEKKETVVNH